MAFSPGSPITLVYSPVHVIQHTPQYEGLTVGVCVDICRRSQSVSRLCTSPWQTKLSSHPSWMPCCTLCIQAKAQVMAARKAMMAH
jgi:hypothetical protein